MERLKLYKFVTDSYVCGGFHPFPKYLGSETLTFNGEEPGKIVDGPLSQSVVGQYLLSLAAPYNATIQGRLVNRTDITTPLNLIQTVDSCNPGEYWNDKQASCVACPKS